MESAREEKIEIARMIWKQLGGGRFSVMTGARNAIATGNGIQFRLPCRKINLVTVILDPFDTYTMTFQKVQKERGSWNFRTDTISEHNEVYADQLQSIFKSETGLETHL